MQDWLCSSAADVICCTTVRTRAIRNRLARHWGLAHVDEVMHEVIADELEHCADLSPRDGDHSEAIYTEAATRNKC